MTQDELLLEAKKLYKASLQAQNHTSRVEITKKVYLLYIRHILLPEINRQIKNDEIAGRTPEEVMIGILTDMQRSVTLTLMPEIEQ